MLTFSRLTFSISLTFSILPTFGMNRCCSHVSSCSVTRSGLLCFSGVHWSLRGCSRQCVNVLAHRSGVGSGPQPFWHLCTTQPRAENSRVCSRLPSCHLSSVIIFNRYILNSQQMYIARHLHMRWPLFLGTYSLPFGRGLSRQNAYVCLRQFVLTLLGQMQLASNNPCRVNELSYEWYQNYRESIPEVIHMVSCYSWAIRLINDTLERHVSRYPSSA